MSLPGTAYAWEAELLPLLAGRRALVIVTRDGQEPGFSGLFWNRVFETCGIDPFEVRETGPLKKMSGAQTSALLDRATGEPAAWFDE